MGRDDQQEPEAAQPIECATIVRAFSGKVDTGFPSENATT
jgi:hypothetical protein